MSKRELLLQEIQSVQDEELIDFILSLIQHFRRKWGAA